MLWLNPLKLTLYNLALQKVLFDATLRDEKR